MLTARSAACRPHSSFVQHLATLSTPTLQQRGAMDVEQAGRKVWLIKVRARQRNLAGTGAGPMYLLAALLLQLLLPALAAPCR